MHPMSSRLSCRAVDFVDDAYLERLAAPRALVDVGQVRELVSKALSKEPLSVPETAVLLAAQTPALREEIQNAARDLKRRIYGSRIVLFAPLYVGNLCVNDCRYCGFRRSNHQAIRRTLSTAELRNEIRALEQRGHKRLIMVFGEHPEYDADYMASCIRCAYDVRDGHGEIRRINVNAAPLDHAGFRTVRAAGIGTYQIFQETYHHRTFARVHPQQTRKADYLWRLDAMDRAFEAGLDDLGIGALFGLADWRFDALGLVTHAWHLKERHGCGPHTISFPRLRPASGGGLAAQTEVSDADFKFLIAVLRLAVPYTGLILTARERADLRREAIEYGVSQIDAGSQIELGGYSGSAHERHLDRGQFTLGDERSLDEVIHELVAQGQIPSFCTACYRLGRTGEHFMEFAIPGFIKRYCTPNALTTFLEYLVDYASDATKAKGMALIDSELEAMDEGPVKRLLLERLESIRQSDTRDLYF